MGAWVGRLRQRRMALMTSGSLMAATTRMGLAWHLGQLRTSIAKTRFMRAAQVM